MKNSVIIKTPCKKHYFDLIRFAIESMAKDIHFAKKESKELIDAAYELFENAITHAYGNKEGIIEVELHSFDYGLRIDIHDWGTPMAANKYASVPIDLQADKGFNRIYKLVDLFEYKNLGKDGKKFSIIKYFHYKKTALEKENSSFNKISDHAALDTPIKIRNFKPKDEEAIAKLIYQNYGYSYIKELFYHPKKILEHQNKKLFCIVAVDETTDKIVGHFALIKIEDSNIAEIGVVVVDPLYKGMKIMNKMFDAIILRAKELGFDAIFGEAVMFHTFSQKSNLSHDFKESALLFGRAPEDVTIENNELTKKSLRGSVLIAYKIFRYPSQRLTIPDTYKEIILKTYKTANLPINLSKPNVQNKHKPVHLYYNYDPLMNIATIVIDHYGKYFKHKFLLLLSQLQAKHCDMIYAEINLNDNPFIDKIVKILNKRGFFYAGILYLKHKNQDYLSLQSKHSMHIGKKNLICHSNFCKELLEYIKKDEQRVKWKI